MGCFFHGNHQDEDPEKGEYAFVKSFHLRNAYTGKTCSSPAIIPPLQK
jgi:hypothetical protein